MKRGTITLPKTLKLAKLLGIRRREAVGLLEELFHFTARAAVQGDIGRHENEEIAEAIDWERDPEILINALKASKWLDPSEGPFRLIVHNWSKHCEETCDKYLAANGLHYADGMPPRCKATLSLKAAKIREKSRQPELEPEPESKPHSEGERDEVVFHDDGNRNSEGRFYAVFKALRATGKMDQLTYEHIAKVSDEYPLAQLANKDNYDEIVLELSGVAGDVGTVLQWLRKAVSRLQARNLEKTHRKGSLFNGGPPAASM